MDDVVESGRSGHHVVEVPDHVVEHGVHVAHAPVALLQGTNPLGDVIDARGSDRQLLGPSQHFGIDAIPTAFHCLEAVGHALESCHPLEKVVEGDRLGTGVTIYRLGPLLPGARRGGLHRRRRGGVPWQGGPDGGRPDQRLLGTSDPHVDAAAKLAPAHRPTVGAGARRDRPPWHGHSPPKSEARTPDTSPSVDGTQRPSRRLGPPRRCRSRCGGAHRRDRSAAL